MLVACEGKIVEYDPEYFFCDYPYVPEGAMHSQGNYPLVTIQLSSPESFREHSISILCRSNRYNTVLDKPGFSVGRACTVDLPKDFLSGDFKIIEDLDAKNFRLLDLNEQETLEGSNSTPTNVESEKNR
jgi:hypothetical protein